MSRHDSQPRLWLARGVSLVIMKWFGTSSTTLYPLGAATELDSKYLRACGTLSCSNSFKAADPLWVAKTAERPDSEKNEHGTKEHTYKDSQHSLTPKQMTMTLIAKTLTYAILFLQWTEMPMVYCPRERHVNVTEDILRRTHVHCASYICSSSKTWEFGNTLSVGNHRLHDLASKTTIVHIE